VTAPVTAATPTTKPTTTTPASTTTANSALGKNDFLKLLVAQLKYQNPMSPTDPSSFMAQTAQFSMVEKLEQMAADSSELLTEQRWTTATALLGRQITWTAADANGNPITKTGVVTGAKTGTSATGPTLLVGDTEVPNGSVTSVNTASAPSTSAT